ncbi:MAG: hypothetical protein L3J09_05300 [Flavobacteriaceae bacterium]|nr:hypothetical protein [Flavobacteriaceae bacterium]
MKPLLSLLILLVSFSVFAQEVDLEKNIQSLKTKIQQSEKGEKLKWMDSLSNSIAFDTSFENDSIVLATRNYAIELDSFDIAIHQTANLIYFQNNIKGAPQKGKELYLQNRKYLPKVNNNIVKCKFYYDAASGLFYLSEFEESLQLFDSVYYWAEQENNSKYIGRSKLGKGQVFTDMGDFGNASITLQDAIRYFQKIKDTSSLNDTRNSLAILYSKNRFYKEAKAERDEIIKQSLATENYDNLPSFYYNAAGDEKNIGNRKGQIDYLNLALESSRKSRFIALFL